MIYPEDEWKGIWDLFITIVLISTCVITPYIIAFDVGDKEKNPGWYWSNVIMDICFALDIVLTFLTCRYDEDFVLEQDRWEIAKSYLSGWFLIDFVAVLRFNWFIPDMTDEGIGNKMGRALKIGKLSKLIKLTRLLRILKMVKEKSKLVKYLKAIMRIGVGIQRLIFFMLASMLICHIFTCLWIFFAKLSVDADSQYEGTWIGANEKFHDASSSELYLSSFYFIITTITTVGYGDIYPTKSNPTEMILGIVLMIGGVIGFSFASGALTSIL